MKRAFITGFVISIFLFWIFGLHDVAAGGSSQVIKSNLPPKEETDQGLGNEYDLGLSFNKEGSSQRVDDLWFTRKDWLSIIISTIVGGLLGFGTVIFVDWLREPNLKFYKGSEDEDTAHKWRFIHIKIVNLNRKYKFIPITTSSASSAKAIVRIWDNGKPKSFIGRWTSKEEPIVYGPGNNNWLNLNAVLVTPREDIHPVDIKRQEDETVQIAIGLKYENEKEFYGFNNESYLHQPHLKNPKYKFGIGDYEGEIVISCNGKRYPQKFKVHNGSTKRKDLSLEII